MIRPTMSHVLNKQDLYEQLSVYATYLESKIAELEDEAVELKEESSSLHVYSFRVIAFVTRAVEKLRGVPEFKPTGDVLNRVLRLTPKIALEAHDLERTRKGFWLGFEDARCHPSEMNILSQWEGTKVFKQAKALKE